MSIEIRTSIEFELKHRILVISDNPENRTGLSDILSAEYEVDFASTGREAIEKYADFSSYALNILDLNLPDQDASDFIRLFRSQEQIGRVPIMAIMAEKGHEADVLRSGAIDFIRKPFQPEVILARCERIIELSVDQTLIRQAQDDSLTGLYNREFFFEYVREIQKNLENPVQDAIVLNVEHFHLINELYGREFGNRLLVRIADTIREYKDEMASIACRTDSDVFYIYCRHQDSYDLFVSLLNQRLNQQLNKSSAEQRLRLRAGVYQNVDPWDEPELWFDRAKKACDQIRGIHTRNICYYDSSLYEKSIFDEKLIHDVDSAIQEKRIVVYFQPKFDIKGEERRLCSAEALVRWEHPEFGLITPDKFIPLFEKNGLIWKLDHYVWDESARQVSIWKERYNIDLPVSVNVSRIDIYNVQLEDVFESLLQKYSLAKGMIHLEITESAYSEDSEHLVSMVEKLRDKGFLVEMDDFGSGYSSLNMLSRMPFDVLKLDREFINNMMSSKKGYRVVELIIDLARYLQVKCIAEGVETREEYLTLKNLGCDIIQGFFFARPMSPAEFDSFLQKECQSQ